MSVTNTELRTFQINNITNKIFYRYESTNFMATYDF